MMSGVLSTACIACGSKDTTHGRQSCKYMSYALRMQLFQHIAGQEANGLQLFQDHLITRGTPAALWN